MASQLSVAVTFAQETAEPRVAPWNEAVISVAEFEPATKLFRHAGGWRLTASGKMSRSELTYWRLPEKATGSFERWCAPKADTGCVRFIRFSGVKQEPIRPAARAWDTGGIYSIMVRSDNIPALYQQALELGWWAESPPIRFQFGSSDLRNVVLTGPHGIQLAVYERIKPDFTAFPVGRLSQGFNSMRMVRDRVAARDFYRNKLGFGLLFDVASEDAQPTPSNFGIPLNYTPKIKRAAAALFPTPGETGRVEVMQIDGFTGLDHSSRAVAPNLGILSVRFPVQTLKNYQATLSARGVKPVQQARNVQISGLGKANIFAIKSPDGSLTEFYEIAD